MENRKKRKMYRWTVWFLSVFLIPALCTFPALADEECPEGEHDWVLDNYDAPTCYDNGLAGYYCSKCGDWKRELIPATGHSWSEWTQLVLYNNDGTVKQGDCTKGLSQYRTCTVCGATDYRIKEPWEHNFDSWVTVRTGTCQQEGLQRRTCKDCGIVEERTTGYGDHQYGSWVETKPATCTEQGTYYYECQLCGERVYYYEDLIPHTFGEWTIKKEATDFTTGTWKRSCTVCGFEEDSAFYPDGTVFYGDYNDIVYELQEALNRGGYDCGEADGSFGDNTWRAVTDFERDHNIAEDGIGWPGIRRILAEEAQNRRPEIMPDASNTPEEPSNNNTNANNTNVAALICSVKEHKAYAPEGRDCYYLNEPVVIWVNVKNTTSTNMTDVYCFDDDTGNKLIYDPHIYPDYKAGQEWYKETLYYESETSFMHFHQVTPEDADAGKYVFRVYAVATDASGSEIRTEIAELEVKTDNGYNRPGRQMKEPSEEPTIELRESTQAGHWMEDPTDSYGYYYYSPEDIVRYKILVKNETEDPIYHIVIGYDLTPININPVKIPGQKEDLPFELDEGDANIRLDVMEAGEIRAFYLWCAVEPVNGEKDTMKHEARMTYTGQDGIIRTIESEPCEVNTGIDPLSGSEE